MKILYFGTICNKEQYMQMLTGFRTKPSVAPFVFESALLQGFRDNGAQLEVRSFPVIPAFPKSKHLGWGNRTENLESGYQTQWIGAVNISGIKQMSQRISSHVTLKKWLKENADQEKAVVIYSAYQPISKSIVTLCKKHGTNCYAIIPDLPRDMYSVARINPVKKFLSGFYVRSAVKTQGCFDGYIYLTGHMKEVINPAAPYIVVEGIANGAEAQELSLQNKAAPKAIMYAGALSEKYGLRNLIEAFLAADLGDTQLWLFGSGDFREEIEKYAQTDPRIRFFGRVPREEILEYEKQATLLVNVRSDSDAFTKYSFPSKVIEYMLSGTPLLMTRLAGIPEEYYGYTFSVSDNSVETLKAEFEKICAMPAQELLAFGAKAQEFIAGQKNSRIQAEKILDLIQKESNPQG